VLAAVAPPRRCPLCGSPVPELLSPSGRRRPGRPRVFCSERCRTGDRRARVTPPPGGRGDQVAAFAAAVRSAVAARGLPLRELAIELAAAYPSLASGVATLSAWQSGSSAPPHTATGRDRVLALERCLRLPAGDLALLMPGGPAVAAPRPPADSDDTLAARRARLAHLLGALEGPQQVLPVSVSKDIRLGSGRSPVRVRTTVLVRAAHDGVDRLWYVDGADPRLRPAVGETAGCRAVRRVPEPNAPGPGLVAAELVLDRPLARGELHEISFTVRYEPGHPEPYPGERREPGHPLEPVYRHVLEQPAERLELTVRFDRRSAPAEVLACRWRPRTGAEASRQRVTEAGARAYRLVIPDPAPGGYGWRWAPAPLRLPAPRRPGTSAA
jgi:hypothetical protein